MLQPHDLNVIVSTFERPDHLRRCLASLAQQTLAANRFAIVIADDGSRDETPEVTQQFAESSPVECRFVTHPHDGFRKAKAVNAALRETTADYLVLTDGDCIFPPDHLEQHLLARQPSVVRAGNSVYLNESDSQRVDLSSIESGRWLDIVPRKLTFALQQTYWKSRYYETIRHATKPRIVGNNFGVWRQALEAINGFDERFKGWGCEDDDVGLRLRAVGQQIKTILAQTHAFHLWHPNDPSRTAAWQDGQNVKYFQRPIRLRRCLHGMRHIPLEQLVVRITAGPEHFGLAAALESRFRPNLADQSPMPTLEVLLWSAGQSFVGDAEVKILVSGRDKIPSRSIVQQADVHFQFAGNLRMSQEHREDVRNSTSTQLAWLMDQIAAQIGVGETASKPMERAHDSRTYPRAVA